MRQIEQVQRHGGLPILFQSFGLTSQSDNDLIAGYADIGKQCGDFLAFELGTMFAPFGKIYSLDVYRELVKIPQCLGAKHSSLDRGQEWERIEVRDATRPDFLVLTGNDLAIDMVFYGSDYLLGLSTFAPDLFALRDRWWAEGNAMAISLNDILQYLGFLAFRNPVPAYKHSAAQFLKLRGWLDCDLTSLAVPSVPIRTLRFGRKRWNCFDLIFREIRSPRAMSNGKARFLVKHAVLKAAAWSWRSISSGVKTTIGTVAMVRLGDFESG